MAKPKAPAKAEGESRPAKKPLVPLSTLIAAVVLIPVGFCGFKGFKRWSGVRERGDKFESSFATVLKENAALSKVYGAVQMKRYEICNKSTETVTVHWVTAAYHDGTQVKVFDSSRCRDWEEPVLVPGDSKIMQLRSSQEGCNWSGNVFYYAMRYTLESEDRFAVINMVGPYQGFDRDCYTIQ